MILIICPVGPKVKADLLRWASKRQIYSMFGSFILKTVSTVKDKELGCTIAALDEIGILNCLLLYMYNERDMLTKTR